MEGAVSTRRVILVGTAPADRPHGSMVRYGTLVREALEKQGAAGFQTDELNLSPAQKGLDRWPKPLQTPIRYWRIGAQARQALPDRRDCLLHLLDGSHAYLLGAVRQLSAPLVITVHDLIPALCLRGELPGPRPGPGAAWIIRRTLAGLARADAWVADSTSTRNDLVRLAGVDPGRVQVVHPAVTLNPAAAAPGNGPGTATPYILHVAGNNNFYKNRAGVIEIFAAIRRSVPVRLKLVGAPPDAALLRRIAAAGVRDAVEFLPNVAEPELAALYRGAAFLLFPSTYEGFGWPPLEAMACGCPVICSTAGSLAEVVGETALTAAPDDVAGLAAHGLRLLREPATRLALVDAGFQHVRKFSSENLAAGLVRAYAAAEEAFRRHPAAGSIS